MNSETEQIFLVNPSVSQPSTSQEKLDEIPVTNQVNLENVADFSSVCRTCATITQFLIPIFSGEGLQNNLADKIHKHLPIQVSEGDQLPVSVCYQCAHTLLACAELAASCGRADAALRARLAQLAQLQPVQLPPTVQDLETIPTEEPKTVEDKEQKQTTPCVYAADKATEITTPKTDDEDTNDFEGVESDSDEDLPLSTVASQKTTESYNKFYNCLVNFFNHFDNDHKTENLPDTTESSDSEVVPEDVVDDDFNVDNFDDLTHSNMRKDRMDEKTRLELNQVRTKINGKIQYTCKICGKNLSASHTYVFHMRTHTGERPCVCHICGKQFTAPSGLQRHVTETHEKRRRLSCRFCPKNFANSQSLKQHMRIHTGERPFVCTQCGKRFTQSASLYVHMQTHNDQTPHQCTECGAKFKLKSGLSRHKLRHTGEKPHVCGHCGKGFSHKYVLTNHCISHTESKPFTCTVCGAVFRHRKSLNHHVRKLHENEQNRDLTRAMPRGQNMLVYTHIGQYQ